MEKYNSLGARIKECRTKLNISQKDIAKELNYTQSAFSQYENDTREPSLTDLKRIALKLNTTTDYLLGLTESRSLKQSVREISDYTGLSDEAISVLHSKVADLKKGLLDTEIKKEVSYNIGGDCTNEEFIREYTIVKKYAEYRLYDYTHVLNELILSDFFVVLIRKLENNLFFDRCIYDVLKILAKQYNDFEEPLLEDSVFERARTLTEIGEDTIKDYALNIFDLQNEFMEFCKNLTRLEIIKKLSDQNDFYRKINVLLHFCVKDMLENNSSSTEDLEKKIATCLSKECTIAREILKIKPEDKVFEN